MAINITESGNKLSSGDKSITVNQSPVPGSDLPEVTFQNDTALNLALTFTTTPFTKSSYPIGPTPGSVSPEWLASVGKGAYDFTVSEQKTTRDEGVQPAHGNITISVIAE